MTTQHFGITGSDTPGLCTFIIDGPITAQINDLPNAAEAQDHTYDGGRHGFLVTEVRAEHREKLREGLLKVGLIEGLPEHQEEAQ